MRISRALPVLVLTAAAVGACQEGTPSSPTPASLATSSHPDGQNPASSTIRMDAPPPLDHFAIEGAEAFVTLTRNGLGSFHWQLHASGMVKGHAYTIWILNGTNPLSPDGGHAHGGLVGGSGQLTAGGNHCVSELKFRSDFPVGFGFEPGISTPDCDVVDPDGTVTFVLVDHGPWTPGDMAARWQPFGTNFIWATFEGTGS